MSPHKEGTVTTWGTRLRTAFHLRAGNYLRAENGPFGLGGWGREGFKGMGVVLIRGTRRRLTYSMVLRAMTK